MTDTEKDLSSELPAATEHAPRRAGRILAGVIFVVAALAIAAYAGGLFVKTHMGSGVSVAPSSTAVVMQMDQRIAALEQKVQTLDDRLNELAARVDKNAAALSAPPTTMPASPVAAQDTSPMQNDITSLSATLSALQTKVKQTANAATQAQQATQNGVAASIAFVQLQQAAVAGRSFTGELADLRRLAGNDSGIQEALSPLDAQAAKGAPPLDVLREEFVGLEPAASVAVDTAQAQNWHERLMVDLKGLVSIRPLHGGISGDFATIENALASGDLAAALEAVKTLPSEAQAVLAGWKSKAEARLAIDTALHAVADRFIAQAASVPRDNP